MGHVALMRRTQEVAGMFEIKVVYDIEDRYLDIQRHPSVRRDKEVCSGFTNDSRHTPLEVDMPQEGVTSLRMQYYWMHIGRKEELRVGCPVEEKEKLMFGVRRNNTSHCLACEPSDAVETTGDEQTSVNSNNHIQKKL